MQSDNILLDLILHKQMSHFVVDMELISSLLGVGPAVKVNDFCSCAMLQLNELKGAEVNPIQFDELIISVNTTSKASTGILLKSLWMEVKDLYCEE